MIIDSGPFLHLLGLDNQGGRDEEGVCFGLLRNIASRDNGL